MWKCLACQVLAISLKYYWKQWKLAQLPGTKLISPTGLLRLILVNGGKCIQSGISIKNTVGIFQTLIGEQGDIRIRREGKMPERAFSRDVLNPKGIAQELNKRKGITYKSQASWVDWFRSL